MIAKLKTWIATVGTLLLAILTLGGYARYQKRRAEKAEQQNKQKDEILKRAKQRQETVHDAYRLDADDIDKRLQGDYRD